MIVNMSMSALLLQSIPNTDVSLREGKKDIIQQSEGEMRKR